MKKEIISKILGCAATAIITVVLILYMGHMLDPRWSEDGMDVIKAFHSIDDNSLDVIIYGSSHAWRGCDTRVMHDDYGLLAYNYACNWQAINTILLFLKDSLRTQTPRVACVEVGRVDIIEQDVDLDGQIYYTRAIPYFDGKKEYLNQCFNGDVDRYISYYFPLVMFHENWKIINYENFRFPDPGRFLDTRGYCEGTVSTPYEIPDYKTMEQKEIPKECIAVLDEMVKTCNNKGVELLFFTCPYADDYYYSDAMKRYAEDNNCKYLNLFEHIDDMGLDGMKDLEDESHLNESGAGKVATYLSEFIVDNYAVE